MLQLRRNSPILLLLLALIASTPASAFGPGRDQPVHVASDRAELDDLNGRSTYSGNVIITQGLARLEADKVVIHSTQADGITKMVATGNQAHYQEQETPSSPVTHAYADTIIYTQADETLQLIKNARLEQSKNSFQGDEIRYNTATRKVTASADKESGTGSRVEMIFHPKKQPPARAEEPAQP